jgi:hypothetical protein
MRLQASLYNKENPNKILSHTVDQEGKYLYTSQVLFTPINIQDTNIKLTFKGVMKRQVYFLNITRKDLI